MIKSYVLGSARCKAFQTREGRMKARFFFNLDAAEGSFYRDELLARIISICSHNNYQYITNFEW